MVQLKESKYVTIPQVAKLLGLSRIAVFKKVKKGEIPAQRIGRTYAISRDFLRRLQGEAVGRQDKDLIDRAVKKTVKEYGETLKLLGRE